VLWQDIRRPLALSTCQFLTRQQRFWSSRCSAGSSSTRTLETALTGTCAGATTRMDSGTFLPTSGLAFSHSIFLPVPSWISTLLLGPLLAFSKVALQFGLHLYVGTFPVVYFLTSAQPYRLRIEMKQASDNRWFSTEYWSFLIGDGPNDKYRLDVSALATV